MSAPPAPLTVAPGGPLTGAFEPPGDKSVTHRAYLLGSLALGTTTVTRPNAGADCEATLRCLAALGVRIERVADGVRIEGRAGRYDPPAGPLDCGNSGTTLRLLAGPLAFQPFPSTLIGDASLSRRPVGRVVAPLRRMGARVAAADGDRVPPLVVEGGALRGIDWPLDVASAQVASCVLLAGLGADGETAVALPGPARDHTERMLPAFGVAVEVRAREGAGPRVALLGPATPRAATVRIVGDLSAAAFFLAAAAACPGAVVTARGVSLNPTRTGLLDVLEAMGAAVERRPRGVEGGEPVGDVTVTGPPFLVGFDVPAAWVPRLLDEAPAWCIAASAARGRSTLSGAAELRVKESDRVATLARNLAGLGVAVEERPDGLAIEGGPVRGGAVTSAGDHRIAMAFATLGTRAAAPVTVDDAASIVTSFPGFVPTLEALGGRVVDAPGARSSA